ncbi:membrane cofactor protein-like isoform X3 [Chanodichthys erythropterus]|uniref:membrane cofactor protein-like isoform X3 n=1 Tax=Chanodichthys erythropterus TaxID=933992 RepID=UPI00351EC928
MGCKVLYFSVALLLCLMICEHVRAQCAQPSFEPKNVILSGSSLSTQSFPDGSTVTFECIVGHTPVNSRASKSVTCLGNQWTSLELTCTRKSCGSLPDFQNGKYEGTGVLFGDKMTAVCNKGYMLAGQMKDRWCRDQGWDGRDPVCEVVKCEAPPTIENGQLDEVPRDSYDYSEVVSYKCNRGWSLTGSSTLHCSEDGTFKPDPPKCFDGCPNPAVSNARRIGGKSPPYKLGNFVDYECEESYTMKGDYHIVCSAEGWKPEPPKCIEPCDKPVLKEHVILTSEFSSKAIFPLGSKVTVECMTGYEPVDSTVSKSITCVETNWTELLLTCNAPTTTAATTTTTTTITTTTTATTATKVTSKIQPKDEQPSSNNYAAIICGILGALAVLGGGGYFLYNKRSKRQCSEKVATNEDRML